jgi:hypothetical protein
MMNKEIFNHQIDQRSEIKTIVYFLQIGIYEYNTTSLQSGTYISSLHVNGDKVATHKFQVQH